MPKLPDVFQIGPFSLPTYPLGLMAGFYVWFSLASRLAGRRGVDRRLVEELVYRLAVGGFLGAKLMEVVRSPASFLASPRLLVSVPAGALPLFGALLGGILWTIPLLRGRWGQLPRVLDAISVPMAIGLGIASLGRADDWSFPLAGAFVFVAVALEGLRRQAAFEGHTALAGVILGCLALVAADFFRPVPSLVAGISLFQLVAALVGATAYGIALRLASKSS